MTAAASWGLHSGYQALMETPTGTIGQNPIPKEDLSAQKYSEFINPENAGKSVDGAGTNLPDMIKKGADVFPVMDNQGNLIGLYARDGASSFANLPNVGIDHIAVVLKGTNGQFYNSMSGLTGGNIWGITSTCQQMSNQAFLQAGYAMTVNSMQSGWFSYVTAAIYGPYGSAAPALSYYEWDQRR